jgi:hypothetical protein
MTSCQPFPLLTGQPEPEDLRPVGVVHRLGLVVHGGDRRLQLIRAGAALGEGGGNQGGALIDLGPVPAGAVLLAA